MTTEDPVSAFIEAASVPLGGASHTEGDLALAEAIRAAHPALVGADVFTAAILGDLDRLGALLDADPSRASAKGGLYDWDPLTYLCFSRYLRLEPARSEAFVACAELLLDRGASAQTGFFSTEHTPHPEIESVIYAASSIARNVALTNLLLERGADPNDGETPYHVAESYDNTSMKALVESGKLHADSLATILLRKHDWHDLEGIRWLLAHGADPNRMTQWGVRALHQALRRNNALPHIESLLERGADPKLDSKVGTGVELAARQGRGDVLALYRERGVDITLTGVDALVSACARGEREEAHALGQREPEALRSLVADAGAVLAGFARSGNTAGVTCLLDLGCPIDARWTENDPNLACGANNTALHIAAWCARHETLPRLIERGADVNTVNDRGDTPLELAVRAIVDSHWKQRRSTASVESLLRAGADPMRLSRFPSGDAEIDALLGAARNRGQGRGHE